MKQVNISTTKNVVFHFLPGIAVTAIFLLLTAIFPPSKVPNALMFTISTLAIIPVMLYIMKRYSPDGTVKGAVGYTKRIPAWKLMAVGVGAILWAGLVMTLAKPVSNFLFDKLFWWMKGIFDISGYLAVPAVYSKTAVITTWAVGLVITAIFVPVVEELYFRGFLMRNLEKYGIGAVVLSALFFSLYHIFSPWMFVMRFIAFLPALYFVWRYKDLRIAILFHVLANVVGDSIFAIPVVFGI